MPKLALKDIIGLIYKDNGFYIATIVEIDKSTHEHAPSLIYFATADDFYDSEYASAFEQREVVLISQHEENKKLVILLN